MMKKILFSLEMIFMILLFTSCSDTKKMEEIDMGFQTVDVLDDKNITNISKWEEIPIVTDEMLSLGYSGGEGGQWPLSLTGDNIDGSLMFYTTDVGGVYKSTDYGNTWYKKNKGLYSQGACDVLIDPNNKDRVILFGTNGPNISYTTGIYLSTDQGESWNFIKHFPINGYRNTKEDIAFDPTSYDAFINGSSIIYLSLIEKEDYTTSVLTSSNKGLYKSVDGGITWIQINKDLGDAIVKVDSRGYLFCGNYNGLYISFDKGLNFTKILSENVQGLDVVGDKAYILTDGEISDNLYMYSNDLELIQSFSGAKMDDPDGGSISLYSESWQRSFVNEGNDLYYQYHYDPSVHHLYTIKVSPINPMNMVMILTNPLYYEAASNTVLYSTDGGHTFNISLPNKLKTDSYREYNVLPYANRRMNFYWSRKDENILYDFENDWLSISTDKGKSFKYYSNGINGIMCGGKFNFNVYDSDILYFGAQDYHGALTLNGGKSFSYINLGKNNILNDNANIYGGYAASSDLLYAVFAPRNSNNRYIVVSYDGGASSKIIMDESHLITEGYIKPNGVSRLKEQSNYISIGSKTNKNVLFCANLRSFDFGMTWYPMEGVTGVYQETDEGILYGINDTLGQIVYSTDLGASWKVLVESKDLNKWWDNAYLSDLALDNKNQKLYVTCQWQFLFQIDLSTLEVIDLSENIRKSFNNDLDIETNLGNDLSERRLLTVAVDPNHSEIIYVGGANYKYRSDASLFRSTDGGKTFSVINSNLTDSIVTGIEGGAEPLCIRVNPKDGSLWVGGNCLGFSKISPPYENDLDLKYHKVKLIDELNRKTYIYYVYDKRRFITPNLSLDGYVLDTNWDHLIIEEDTTLYIKWKKL